jgi:MYXO-CTERM domain-containing protein
VDTGNNLQNCVAALNALLNVKVSGSASSECSNGQCSAEAKGSVSACSTEPGNANAPLLPGGLVLGMGVLAFARSRRRRS